MQQIIKAKYNDLQTLSDISISTFRESWSDYNKPDDMDKYVCEELNIEKLSAEISDEHNHIFFSFIENQITGYAKIRIAMHPDAPADSLRPAEIERFYIRKQFHGLKIGSALMEHCFQFAREMGCDYLWLGVWEDNPAGAIHFYERFGFKKFGAHPFILGNDHQVDTLMKVLL